MLRFLQFETFFKTWIKQSTQRCEIDTSINKSLLCSEVHIDRDRYRIDSPVDNVK